MPKQTLKQRKDGRYRCKYKDVFFYGDTPGEALQKREAYKIEEAQGIQRKNAGMTFHEYASQWLPIYRTSCTLKTYNDYASKIEKMCEVIGSIKMRDLTQSDVRTAYNHVAGYSDSYLKKYSMTLRRICACAFADGACVRDPASGLKPPKGKSGTHRELTKAEIQMILDAAPKHHFGAMAMTMLFAGLRRGEALALDIDKHIDFQTKVIHVRGAIAFEGNNPVLTKGKTYNAQRDIPLLPPLERFLEGRHGLLLPGASTKYATETICKKQYASFIRLMECELNGVSQKRWYGQTKEHKAIIAQGGALPPWQNINIRMHDFRHTYCVMLFDSGVDMKTAQKWMGHADATMIMKIYDHLSDIRVQKSTEAMVRLVENLVENVDKGSKRGSNAAQKTLNSL